MDTDVDSVSGLSLDVGVDEGSSSDCDVEVDAGLALSDVAGEDSGVALATIDELLLLEPSEDAGTDETDVGLAEAPVPLGTICRYRSAWSTSLAYTSDSDAKIHSSILVDARNRFILALEVNASKERK